MCITNSVKKCNFLSLYFSPNQSKDELDKFIKNLELTFDTRYKINTFLIVFLGDFNVKYNNWYCNDKTTDKASKVAFLASQSGPHQLIKEPTHVLENVSPCNDLFFMSQPNLVIHPSLYPNCHHYIIYSKFNLKIRYPQLSERKIWHCSKADTELIRGSISDFNWETAF